MDPVSILGRVLTVNGVTIGKNLNVSVIRGFARLDELALISSADVFDQVNNPLGTQRDPNKLHAKQVLEYAMNSIGEPAETSPHAFPEIILNARDASAVRLFIGADREEVEFNSSDESDREYHGGSIEIDVEKASSASAQPVFSRVDGNHRLLLVLEQIKEDKETEFPSVPFSLFVGLSPDQERSIFRDINGEQKSMETAHLDQIKLKLHGDFELLSTDSGEALWIANKLQSPGGPFEGMVFMGGAKLGLKASGKTVPPIRISSLKSAVAATIKDSNAIVSLMSNDESEQAQTQNALTKLKLLQLFWESVKTNFSSAWQDKNKFVLMQSIGLTSFSKLAAVVIDDLLEKKTVDASSFDSVLAHIAGSVDLSKERWAGYAGAVGAREVFNVLQKARLEGFDTAQILAQLHDKPVSPLDE